MMEDSVNESETYVNVGHWVVVNFEGATYPGEVVEVQSMNHVTVNVMHQSGKGWRWPDNPDMIPYDIDEILKKIRPLVPTGSRGQFHIDL